MTDRQDMREALQACVDAMLHDGVPTDPEHPKQIALSAAEAALAARDAQENLASETAVKDSRVKVSQCAARDAKTIAWHFEREEEGEKASFVTSDRRVADAYMQVGGWKATPLGPIGCDAQAESGALQDMLDDARLELSHIRAALGVPYEPHQTLYERTMDAARAAAPSREQVGETAAQHACTCGGSLGHTRSCPSFDESMMRYEPFASPSRECWEPFPKNLPSRVKIAVALHYPDHWDSAAYPTLDHAAWEAIAAAKLTCSECGERQLSDEQIKDAFYKAGVVFAFERDVQRGINAVRALLSKGV